MPRLRLLAAVLVIASAVVAATSSCQPPSINGDPATWSNHDLAAQLVVAGADMGNLPAAQRWVHGGLGGVVLLGTPPANLGAQLQAVRGAGAVPPLISSDEEGGQVQRLTRLIYPLPSGWAAASTPRRSRGWRSTTAGT